MRRLNDLSSLFAKVSRIAVVTTDCCQAHCAHCLMESSPDRSNRLYVDDVIAFVDGLMSKAPVKMVVFTGGESTLLGDDLLEMISYCASNGLLTRLVTNAAWAIDELSAEGMLKDLRDAGLSEINFSTDDFHIPWVPFGNIKRAWDASKGKGFCRSL